MRLGVAVAVLLLAGCAATDDPYVPPRPSTSPSSEGPVLIETGPSNKEIFANIERAEDAVDGVAVAVQTRLNSYVVTVATAEDIYEVTIVGDGIITNLVTERSDDNEANGVEQVVTLADAIDAAAVIVPGRVEAATISFLADEDDPVFRVTIETDSGVVVVTVDGHSADVLGTETLEESEE
ncbi:MAG: hypothetical protein QMB98_03625 [Flaviflexus sp.]|uniref:hypothetical protein n=1 Tax=Flaviflexus sp. TaxID=1969482 RepID=UPI00352F8606